GFRSRRRQTPGGAVSGLSIEPDAWVEDGVGEIHEEVHHHEEGAVDDDHAAEQEDVTVEYGVDEERSCTGNIEDRFHDDGARQEICRERPKEGDYGEERDLHCVA